MAWRTFDPTDLHADGALHFADAPGGRGTEVMVTMELSFPPQSLAAAFRDMFRARGDAMVLDALRRFKQICEAGEVATVTGQASGAAAGEAREAEPPAARALDVAARAPTGDQPSGDALPWR